MALNYRNNKEAEESEIELFNPVYILDNMNKSQHFLEDSSVTGYVSEETFTLLKQTQGNPPQITIESGFNIFEQASKTMPLKITFVNRNNHNPSYPWCSIPENNFFNRKFYFPKGSTFEKIGFDNFNYLGNNSVLKEMSTSLKLISKRKEEEIVKMTNQEEFINLFKKIRGCHSFFRLLYIMGEFSNDTIKTKLDEPISDYFIFFYDYEIMLKVVEILQNPNFKFPQLFAYRSLFEYDNKFRSLLKEILIRTKINEEKVNNFKNIINDNLNLNLQFGEIKPDKELTPSDLNKAFISEKDLDDFITKIGKKYPYKETVFLMKNFLIKFYYKRFLNQNLEDEQLTKESTILNENLPSEISIGMEKMKSVYNATKEPMKDHSIGYCSALSALDSLETSISSHKLTLLKHGVDVDDLRDFIKETKKKHFPNEASTEDIINQEGNIEMSFDSLQNNGKLEPSSFSPDDSNIAKLNESTNSTDSLGGYNRGHKDDGDFVAESTISTGLEQESKKKSLIVWLFPDIEEERDHIYEVRRKLPGCEMKEFDDALEECQAYLEQIEKDKDTEVILITSGGFGIKLKEIIKNSTIKSVFIFCVNLEFHKKWADEIPKIKTVTNAFDDIIKFLDQPTMIEMLGKDMFGKLELKQMLNIFESCNHYIYNDFIYHFFEEKKFNLDQAKEDFNKYCSINYKGDASIKELLSKDCDTGKLEENILDYYMQDNSFLEMINNSWIRGDYYALFKLRYAIYLLKREMNNKLVCTKENYPKVLYRELIIDKENLEEFLQLDKGDSIRNDCILLRGFVSFTSINPEKKTDALYEEELDKFSILFRINVNEKDLPNVHPYCEDKEFVLSDNIILKIISREKTCLNKYNYAVDCTFSDITSEREYNIKYLRSYKDFFPFDEPENDDNLYLIKLNNLTKMDDLTLKILNEILEGGCKEPERLFMFYGIIYVNQRKFKEAVEYLKKALKFNQTRNTGDPHLELEIYDLMGKSYSKDNNKKEAIECYNQSIKIYEKFPETNEKEIEKLSNKKKEIKKLPNKKKEIEKLNSMIDSLKRELGKTIYKK